MGKGNDCIDIINHGTFKIRLPKLYKLVVAEAIKHGIDLTEYSFVSAQNTFDIVDVAYTNGQLDFDLSAKGSPKNGYRILSAEVTEALNFSDLEEDY